MLFYCLLGDNVKRKGTRMDPVILLTIISVLTGGAAAIIKAANENGGNK